jgi:holliday junction DNA helicase RuvA
MIARISGTLIHKSVQYLVVDTQGVGYQIMVPLTTFYELPEVGHTVTLHIHTQVKEDAISLFGFLSHGEREAFQVLISVSGIGPRLAMNILSGISVPELMTSIIQGDLKRLVGIPGVGRKMAERLILELKEKVMKMQPSQVLTPAGTGTQRIEALKEDALSALTNLGYKNTAAKDAVDQVMQEESREKLTLDVLLKGALKLLAA